MPFYGFPEKKILYKRKFVLLHSEQYFWSDLKPTCSRTSWTGFGTARWVSFWTRGLRNPMARDTMAVQCKNGVTITFNTSATATKLMLIQFQLVQTVQTDTQSIAIVKSAERWLHLRFDRRSTAIRPCYEPTTIRRPTLRPSFPVLHTIISRPPRGVPR